MVILQHVGPISPGVFNGRPILTGTVAVYVFFALSGFVIAEAVDRFYRGRPVAFAVNRALRILPLFLITVALSGAVHFAFSSSLSDFLDRAPLQIFSLSNLLANFFSIIPGVEPRYNFVPYSWAIEVEIIFYATLTLLTLNLTRWAWLILGISSLICFFVYAATGEPDLFAYIPFFAYGVLCYRSEKRSSILRISTFLSLLGCAFVSIELLRGNVGGVIEDTTIFAYTGLIMVLLITIPILSRIKIKSSFERTDKVIGDLSYPIYLQQFAIILAVFALAPRNPGSIGLVYLFSIILAAVLDRLLEKPLRSVRDAVRGHQLRRARDTENIAALR